MTSTAALLLASTKAASRELIPELDPLTASTTVATTLNSNGSNSNSNNNSGTFSMSSSNSSKTPSLPSLLLTQGRQQQQQQQQQQLTLMPTSSLSEESIPEELTPTTDDESSSSSYTSSGGLGKHFLLMASPASASTSHLELCGVDSTSDNSRHESNSDADSGTRSFRGEIAEDDTQTLTACPSPLPPGDLSLLPETNINSNYSSSSSTHLSVTAASAGVSKPATTTATATATTATTATYATPHSKASLRGSLSTDALSLSDSLPSLSPTAPLSPTILSATTTSASASTSPSSVGTANSGAIVLKSPPASKKSFVRRASSIIRPLSQHLPFHDSSPLSLPSSQPPSAPGSNGDSSVASSTAAAGSAQPSGRGMRLRRLMSVTSLVQMVRSLKVPSPSRASSSSTTPASSVPQSPTLPPSTATFSSMFSLNGDPRAVDRFALDESPTSNTPPPPSSSSSSSSSGDQQPSAGRVSFSAKLPSLFNSKKEDDSSDDEEVPAVPAFSPSLRRRLSLTFRKNNPNGSSSSASNSPATVRKTASFPNDKKPEGAESDGTEPTPPASSTSAPTSSSASPADSPVASIAEKKKSSLFSAVTKRRRHTIGTSANIRLDSCPIAKIRRYAKFLKEYRLGDQQLGNGAFGYVRSAIRKSDGQVFAVKVILKSKVANWFEDPVLGRVPAEISALSRINDRGGHPGVIEIHDAFESDEVYLIVLELPSGTITDLFEYIESSKRLGDTAQSCVIFKQVVEAVQFCHSRGIVHRDIKDENILLDTRTLTAKLIDFGSSLVLDPASAAGGSGPRASINGFLGTREYAAPEHVYRQDHDPYVAEIWALGALLYTIVFAVVPFKDEHATVEAELTFPSPVSELLEDLITKMLQKSPEARPTLAAILAHPWIKLYS